MLNAIANLSSCSDLEELNFSNNRIDSIPELHMKLGNIKILNLAHNRITNLGK